MSLLTTASVTMWWLRNASNVWWAAFWPSKCANFRMRCYTSRDVSTFVKRILSVVPFLVRSAARRHRRIVYFRVRTQTHIILAFTDQWFPHKIVISFDGNECLSARNVLTAWILSNVVAGIMHDLELLRSLIFISCLFDLRIFREVLIHIPCKYAAFSTWELEWKLWIWASFPRVSNRRFLWLDHPLGYYNGRAWKQVC
jgi:hypothetical protein